MGRVSERSGFDTIFGRGRGSALAQAQRDEREIQDRKRAVLSVCTRFYQRFEGGDEIAHDLAVAFALYYGQGDYDPESVYSQVLSPLLYDKEKGESFWRACVAICAAEEPLEAPELTKPAMIFLLNYFSEEGPHPKEQEKDLSSTIRNLFVPALTVRSYTRLQPLIGRMHEILEREHADAWSQITGSLAAVEAIIAAPDEAVIGPMRCWVDLYLQQFVSNHFDGAGANVLKRVRALYRQYPQEAAQILSRYPDGLTSVQTP